MSVERRLLPGSLPPGFGSGTGKLLWLGLTLVGLPVSIVVMPVYAIWLLTFRRKPTPAHPVFFTFIITLAALLGRNGGHGAAVVWLNLLRRLPGVPSDLGKNYCARHNWREIVKLAPAYGLLAYYPLVVYAHDRQHARDPAHAH
jgi:hypothetical protein